MKPKHIKAPLPFQGQKRNFLKEFSKVINHLPDDSIIVDLFGGSGLLSHTAKQTKPTAKVIYNDFDNYTKRLQNINKTNDLIKQLYLQFASCPKEKAFHPFVRKQILEFIGKYQQKNYVDYITLSSNILYSSRYVLSFEELEKAYLYQNITQNKYNADYYLDGVTTVRLDYRKLFEKYKTDKKAFFIFDPPYLLTDCASYKNVKYWKLTDYLNLVELLNEVKYVYFSSKKSSIVELYTWLGKYTKNPFENAKTITRKNHLNRAVSTELMITNAFNH